MTGAAVRRRRATILAIRKLGDFEDDGGPRQQPELDPPEAAAPAPAIDELAHLADEDFADEGMAQRFRPDRRLQFAARAAALDPDDGIAL